MKSTFNVLCIAVRSVNDTHAFFHLPPPHKTAEMQDGTVTYGCMVKKYELKETRSGLGGATVLRLGFGDGILELYTDTPFEGEPVHVTPQFLRGCAKRKLSELWGIP